MKNIGYIVGGLFTDKLSFDEACFSPVAISREKTLEFLIWLLWVVQCSNK